MEGGKRKALILDKFYFTQSKGFCFGLSIFDRTYSFLTLKFEIEILRRFSNLEKNFQNHFQVAFSEKQNFGLMKKKRCSNSWFSSTVEWKWKCIFKMKKSKIKNKHYSKIAKRLLFWHRFRSQASLAFRFLHSEPEKTSAFAAVIILMIDFHNMAF